MCMATSSLPLISENGQCCRSIEGLSYVQEATDRSKSSWRIVRGRTMPDSVGSAAKRDPSAPNASSMDKHVQAISEIVFLFTSVTSLQMGKVLPE